MTNPTTTTQYGETLTITSMTRVGAEGWEWTIEREDGTGAIERWTRRTNGKGRGLWEGDRQISGTSQFELPADRDAAIRVLLRDR